MNSLLIIPSCLGGGLLLKKLGLPVSAARLLTKLVIYVCLPALVLEKIPYLALKPAYALPMLMPWLIFCLAWLLFSWLGRKQNWPRPSKGSVILTAGLGNTSFIGIPVMQAIWGTAGVEVAILADQPGSFACLSTLGIIAAGWYSGEKVSTLGLMRRVLSFPPFLAFLLAFSLNFLQLPPQGLLLDALHGLGSLVVPLALLAVGMQLNLSSFKPVQKYTRFALGYKLLLAPFLIFLVYVLIMRQTGLMAKGSVMEAAMGPMVTATLVAEAYALDPPLARQILSLGILLSFLSLPLWWAILQLF